MKNRQLKFPNDGIKFAGVRVCNLQVQVGRDGIPERTKTDWGAYMRIPNTRLWITLGGLIALAGFCDTASASVTFQIPKTSLSYNGQNLTLKSIDCLAVQSDSANKGKLLIVGPSAENKFLSMIIRLNVNGTLDSTFNSRWAAISCKALAVSPKDGSFVILQDPVTTTQYFVLKMDSTAKNYWYATSPVAMGSNTILRRGLRVLDNGNIQAVVQWTKDSKARALAMQFLTEGGDGNTLTLNTEFGNNGMLAHWTDESQYVHDPFVIKGDGIIHDVGKYYVSVLDSWDNKNQSKTGCPEFKEGSFIDSYFICDSKYYFGSFTADFVLGDALLLNKDKIAIVGLNSKDKIANVVIFGGDYSIRFEGLPLGRLLAQVDVKRVAYVTDDDKLLVLDFASKQALQFPTSPLNFPPVYNNLNTQDAIYAMANNPLGIQKFDHDSVATMDNPIMKNITVGYWSSASGADKKDNVSAPVSSAGGSDSTPKQANCAEGQALVEVSSTDLTSTVKCAVIADLDKDGKCPTGQVVTDAQLCVTATASSGGMAGGSASTKSPTKEPAPVSSAATSSTCPSGQVLQTAKKCVALADLTTDPGADGNCAKDQVLYYVNNVKKCAPEKNATVPQDQSASDGSGGCSLIR